MNLPINDCSYGAVNICFAFILARQEVSIEIPNLLIEPADACPEFDRKLKS